MANPTPLAGLGGVTYGVAKPFLARVVDNGVCDTDPRVLERTNEATKMLLDAIIPVGGMATYDIVADGTTLLLPPALENAIEVEVRGDGLVNNQSDVRQGWYDLVNQFTYVDPSMQHDAPLEDMFLYPDANDPTVLRRKYNFIGLSQGATVRVTGAKRFIPIASDNDYLIVQNLRALKMAIMALERQDINDPDTGQKYYQSAIDMLKAEVAKHLLDPRNSLKRRAKWERDMATFPANSFGWMRARLALEIPGLLTRGKSEITGLLEMAEARLLSKGLWKGSLEMFTAEVVNGIIQLPTRVESVLMARLDGCPIDVRSIFFGYQHNGPSYLGDISSHCSRMLQDLSEVYDPVAQTKRRQYRLTGAFHSPVNGTTPTACLSMVCKLRWLPKQPEEMMVIQNFEALRLMVQGIISEEDEKWQQGMAAQATAVNEVEKELREYQGGTQAVPHIDMVGSPIGGEVL